MKLARSFCCSGEGSDSSVLSTGACEVTENRSLPWHQLNITGDLHLCIDFSSYGEVLSVTLLSVGAEAAHLHGVVPGG